MPPHATPSHLTRALSLEVARVTEAAAVAAARLRGRGDEPAAEHAAVSTMCGELADLPVDGTVVIGDGIPEETEILYVGQNIGRGGPKADIAADPLEGTTLCAKALPNALTVLAVADHGSLLKVPDVYMEKIAIGPGFEDGLVDLDFSPGENLARLARAKAVRVADLTACVLDRPRHAALIAAIREAGAAVRLIGDGDIAGVIHCSDPEGTGIDIYFGFGGAQEGVLAAAALRCIGGQMQGRLAPANDEHRRRVALAGVRDVTRKYAVKEMVTGDVIFAATGITDGSLLNGVKFFRDTIRTHTVLMRGSTGTIRCVHTTHKSEDKFRH